MARRYVGTTDNERMGTHTTTARAMHTFKARQSLYVDPHALGVSDSPWEGFGPGEVGQA